MKWNAGFDDLSQNGMAEAGPEGGREVLKRAFGAISMRFLCHPAVSAVALAVFAYAANGVGTARAETATSYGQSETHWVDPWQATSQAAPTLETAQRSAAPVLAEDGLLPLTQAIAMYREIANQGGWERVPAGERLEPGVRDARVAAVRKRLLAEGDMPVSEGDPHLYDQSVYEGVQRYQMRNGLEPDGIVGRRTVAAMNVPAHTRVRQLELNLHRLTDIVPKLERRYVFVNIAGQEVEAVNNGVVEFRERVIVGTQSRQTPEITSHVASITFNPYWYVPKSIATADMLPKIRANPDYLKRQGIRVLQGWDTNIRELDPHQVDWSNPRINEAYYLRQDPGPYNSLGTVKINFPNSQAIFLHDTPTKTLFGRQERNFSSGCVRVRNVRGLVTWLMQGDDAEWDGGRVDRAIDSRQYRNAYLAQQVPIYLVYLTAWVAGDGMINFRDDVYSRDGSINTSALDN